jgi:ubiquinone/menaquinone biosynthesis C-methylase UbiE
VSGAEGHEQELADNRKLWDAWTAIHTTGAFYDVQRFRDDATDVRIEPWERAEVGDVSGRTLLHLQCHFGLDTLSWARRGAKVTGADLSDEAIRLGRSLSSELGIPAEFVCSDLYDLPRVLDRQFDIVFTSYGVLPWLPDIRRWGETIARFLKPGGTFYIAEFHPITLIFDNTEAATDFRIAFPYFHRPEPIRYTGQGSYAAPDAPYHSVTYEWTHSLADVVNALIDAGLTIEYLHEFPYSIYRSFPFLEKGKDGLWRVPAQEDVLPLLFSIKAWK